MNLIELKCKHCGAVMKVNSELNEIVCNYCGSRILIDDEATKIERVEKAKLNARIKNHEQDIQEAKDQERLEDLALDKKSRKHIKIASIIFIIIVALMTIVGFQDGHIICAIISSIQIVLFILSLLLSSKSIGKLFSNDYKILFWCSLLLSLVWLAFINY